MADIPGNDIMTILDGLFARRVRRVVAALLLLQLISITQAAAHAQEGPIQ